MSAVRLICGDALAVLRTLPDASVHAVITSPPYYSLRDYGTGTWEGGDAACDHGAAYREKRQAQRQPGLRGDHPPGSERDPIRTSCKCGARRIDQQIGREPTPDAYIAALVAVFAEVRRVLHDDGGVGTTALVASRLGRDAISIDLSESYTAMARARMEGDAGMFADLDGDGAGDPGTADNAPGQAMADLFTQAAD